MVRARYRRFDAPAVRLDEVPHQRQAEAEPALAAVAGLLALLEH